MNGSGRGTRDDPWRLKTPSGTSVYVGGWYGLRKGYRGRFGMYLPPLLEGLGLAELEHNPRNNRMRPLIVRYWAPGLVSRSSALGVSLDSWHPATATMITVSRATR